jgi:hypothetical protein
MSCSSARDAVADSSAGAPGRFGASQTAPITTHANAATRRSPNIPPGSGSWKKRHRRRNRNRVRGQRRDAGRGQRSAALETRLQHQGACRVEADHRGAEPSMVTARDDGLGGDVAGGEEDARREPKRGAARQRTRSGRDRGDCRTHRDGQPESDRVPRSCHTLAGASRQGDREQHETQDRDSDSDPLPRLERYTTDPGDEHRKDAYPPGCDRLDEGQRRQSQRNDVENEAAGFQAEPEQPAARAEQEPHCSDRPARRERRQLRGSSMLEQVAPVDRDPRRRGSGRGPGRFPCA